MTQFVALLAAGVGTAFVLDRWAGHEFPTLTVLAVFGSFISYIYSAPPLKLKQSGWIGNYALGSSYIALPWWAGQVCCFVNIKHCQTTSRKRVRVEFDHTLPLTNPSLSYCISRPLDQQGAIPSSRVVLCCVAPLLSHPLICAVVSVYCNVCVCTPLSTPLLPDLSSQALFGELSLDVMVLTVLYSLAGEIHVYRGEAGGWAAMADGNGL